MKRSDKITLALAAGTAVLAMLAASPDADANPGDAEDSPSFSCVLDGNQVCGPHNEMGAVPGLYNNGVLVQSWPVIRTCYFPAGQITDECYDTYVDASLVRMGGMPA